MSGVQLARAWDVVVAVGDDWALPVTFTRGGLPVDISGEVFTAAIYDKAGDLVVTLDQSVSGDDNEVLTVSTADVALTTSPFYRWVLRASSFTDRGLIGGVFAVRSVTSTTLSPPVTIPSIDLDTFAVTTLSGGDAAATFAGLLGGSIDGGTA